MASWLSDIGAKDLATIIQEFSLKRESIVSNPWLDTACYVGFFPPALPKTHDVWLDLADFSVFVFIPTTADWGQEAGGWYSLYPVLNWQMDAFLSIAEWTLKGEGEYWSDEQFSQQLAGAFKSHDSSIVESDYAKEYSPVVCAAYCTWCNRFPMGEDMLLPLETVPEHLSNLMFPHNLRFWQMNDETHWFAVDSETAFYEEDELEIHARETGKQVVFTAIDAPPDSSCVQRVGSSGLRQLNENEVTVFISLLNPLERENIT